MFRVVASSARGLGVVLRGAGAAAVLGLATLPVLSAEETLVQSAARIAQTTSSNLINIIDWDHVRKLVHYDAWPVIPRWGKILLGVAAGTYLTYRVVKRILQVKRFEGIRRFARFYSVAGPFIVRFKFLEWRCKDGKVSQEEEKKLYDAMHEKYAPKFREMCMELSGAFPKIAQVLASRRDLLPARWTSELAVFLDAIKPRPIAEMIEVIEKDMGKPLRETFEWFDAMPIASASLSQVHIGRLKSGEEVAVKIQYPGIEEVMTGDMRLAANFQKKIDKHADPQMFEELEKQFKLEFDFMNEGRNLSVIHKNMQELKDHCEVPRPIYTSKNVLIMTFLPGCGILKDKASPETHEQTVRYIVEAMGKQILVDGVFNGDPHPGNFFAMPDGRAGLLDFGQVKRLPTDMRLKFARIVIALSEGCDDDETLAKLMAETGYRTKKMMPKYVAGFARFNFDNTPWASTGKSGMQAIMEGQLEDPMITMPKDLLFIFRSCMLLRGLLFTNPNISLSKSWRPFAEQALAVAAADL